jgi:(p)ppGpp synthase/HD superfamily hydrolase
MTTTFFDNYGKLYIALKFRLKGDKFYRAMSALELARKIHDGLRKDGKTPEFQHQLEIALHAYRLKGLEGNLLEDAIIVALLHDTDEDYPHKIPFGKLESYGSECAIAIRILNKHTHDGYDEYFGEMSNNLLASLIKGCDRINNFQSMNRGNFTLEKQIKYAGEVVERFLPMLENARNQYPELMDAYYSLEQFLKCQHELISLLIESKSSNVVVNT